MQKTVAGKEVHIGDGEKGVAHSYLGVDLSKHSYTLGQICIVYAFPGLFTHLSNTLRSLAFFHEGYKLRKKCFPVRPTFYLR